MQRELARVRGSKLFACRELATTLPKGGKAPVRSAYRWKIIDTLGLSRESPPTYQSEWEQLRSLLIWSVAAEPPTFGCGEQYRCLFARFLLTASSIS